MHVLTCAKERKPRCACRAAPCPSPTTYVHEFLKLSRSFSLNSVLRAKLTHKTDATTTTTTSDDDLPFTAYCYLKIVVKPPLMHSAGCVRKYFPCFSNNCHHELIIIFLVHTCTLFLFDEFFFFQL